MYNVKIVIIINIKSFSVFKKDINSYRTRSDISLVSFRREGGGYS